MSYELLAVLEVAQSARVRCQAPDCNHPVYQRIHVVRENGRLYVLGRSCFRKLYAGMAIIRKKPSYTSGEGRRLDADELALLMANTTDLVDRLRAEWEQRQDAMAIRHRPAATRSPPVRQQPQALPFGVDMSEIRALALERVKHRHPDLADVLHTPGFAGLVVQAQRDILRERGLA